jgi:hypothetical protein
VFDLNISYRFISVFTTEESIGVQPAPDPVLDLVAPQPDDGFMIFTARQWGRVRIEDVQVRTSAPTDDVMSGWEEAVEIDFPAVESALRFASFADGYVDGPWTLPGVPTSYRVLVLARGRTAVQPPIGWSPEEYETFEDERERTLPERYALHLWPAPATGPKVHRSIGFTYEG